MTLNIRFLAVLLSIREKAKSRQPYPFLRTVEVGGCEYVSANLSRFLDTDLRGIAATQVSAHLRGCLSCRSEFETMRAQQVMVSALSVAPGAAAARDRVLRRLEKDVSALRPNRSSARPLVTNSPFRWFAVAALGAAIAIAASPFTGTKLSNRTKVALHPQPIARPLSQPQPRPLPAEGEMAALFALHDRQNRISLKVISAAAESAPSVARSTASVSSSLPRKRRPHAVPAAPQNGLAKLMPQAGSVDGIALGQGERVSTTAENLASDDVPETL